MMTAYFNETGIPDHYHSGYEFFAVADPGNEAVAVHFEKRKAD